MIATAESTLSMKGSFSAEQFRRLQNFWLDIRRQVFLRLADETFVEVWDVGVHQVNGQVQLIFAQDQFVPPETLLYYR